MLLHRSIILNKAKYYPEQSKARLDLFVMSDEQSVTGDIKKIETSLKQALGKGHPNLYVEAFSPWLLTKDVRRTLLKARLIIGLLASLLLSAGLLGMVSMLLANLNSRIKEIGVHRALGATRARQAAEVLCEAALTGLLGGLVGVLVGKAVLQFLTGSINYSYQSLKGNSG